MMEEVDAFLQHSVVCPTSGDMEGLPVGILEAMSRGLPIISTLHAGIPEAVLEGANGYLVPEGDVEGMAERIVRLAGDPATVADFGKTSWERARDHFSWQLERQRLRALMGLESSPQL
jgi:glycosyltransferase involved in cell wall biosynthesis